MRNRDEHLEWCKERAREYLNQGKPTDAIASIMSDLIKHPEFVGLAEAMTPLGIFYAMNNDLEGARRFVEGFR